MQPEENVAIHMKEAGVDGHTIIYRVVQNGRILTI